MTSHRTAGYAIRALLFASFFLAFIAFGMLWTRNYLVPFFLTRPEINSVIFALAVIALVISFWELIRIVVQGQNLDRLSAHVDEAASASNIQGPVSSMGSGLVRKRCENLFQATDRTGTAMSEAVSMLSDADAEMEESRGAVVRYIIGVMVFLGLMGTFWGLLVTVSGVREVLEALDPKRVDDAAVFVTQLKTSIGDLLGGMSTAFSTSLFGLGGSVILGFVEVQTRQARARLLSDLDSFIASALYPMVLQASQTPLTGPRQDVPDLPSGRLYSIASQETLAENLRRLGEVMAAQGLNSEKITENLVGMQGMFEALKEEQGATRDALQANNVMLRGLLERIDHLGRHMERMVKETRLNKESLDDMSKSLLDQMKLQGEITNKTLSLGFSDLTASIEASRPNGRQSKHTSEETG